MTRVDPATARRLMPRSGVAPQARHPAAVPMAAAIPAAVGSDGERALETQLRQTGASGWIRELRFDEARRWRFDFAWPDLMVAVEVEGGGWVQGRHQRPEGFEADCIKYNEAAIKGWTVLRVTTAMVDDGRAVTAVGRALWSASRRTA